MNAENLGLKACRLAKGVSLDSIAQSTKLSISQLEAIEGGDFARLPGGIYTTNYLRQYARAIGFEEVDLLSFYNESHSRRVSPEPEANKSAGRFARLLFQH